MHAATSLFDMPNDDPFSEPARPVSAPTIRIELVHPFQAAGLGEAPFICLDATLGEDSCKFCGRPIKHLYHVRSSDNCRFVVGSECVNRTGAVLTNFEITRKRFDSRLRAERKAAKLTQAVAQWRELNKDEAGWIAASAKRVPFAEAMQRALAQWGSLTDGQLEAVRKLIKLDADRAAGTLPHQIEAKKREEQAQTIDISRIETAFKTAQSKGLKWPKLTLSKFTFKPAGPNSRNPGAIYVTIGRGFDNSIWLGSVKDGRFVRSRNCTTEQEAEILRVCAAPDEAASEYGRLTGNCAVCCRPLTNKESVARAIGPICAEKFGW